MREIKFRAWDKKENKMIYNDGDNMGWPILIDLEGIVCLNDCQTFEGMMGYELELMQYTGLKDKNGVEIYENDVIRENTEAFGISPMSYIVGFERGHFTLTEVESGYDKMGIWNVVSNMEVIGNIYEHSHLIKTNI